MMRPEILLAGGDVATILAFHLGPNQNWEGVLNDFRQDRRDFGCAPLLPVAKVKRHGRARVPRYRPLDVRTFIDSVRTLYGTAKPFPFKPCLYELDDSDPGGYWFARTATPVTSPRLIP